MLRRACWRQTRAGDPEDPYFADLRKTLSDRRLAFKELKKRTPRGGKLRRTDRSATVTAPGMCAEAVQNASGQSDCGARFCTSDPGALTRADAVDEMLQLAGELVAAGAIQVQHLHMACKHIFLKTGQRTCVQLAEIQPQLAELIGRLYERQLPAGEIETRVSLRGPQAHVT